LAAACAGTALRERSSRPRWTWKRFLKRLTTHESRVTFFLVASLLITATGPVAARESALPPDYPVRSIRIIVASSPGTASDVFARSIGEDLGAFYRQNVMIDNRTGAGGLIGNMLVSKASADGYTLGMVDVTRIITELMRDQPPYRALADVVGVA